MLTLAQIRYRLTKLAGDVRGASAVEFALLLPVLLVLVLGALQFGITLNNYIILTSATDTGARIVALSRGSSTPYSTTTGQVDTSAANLTTANLTVTIRVNGTACGSNSACQTALTNNQGQPVLVQATYPCNLTVFGHNYAPNCTLTAHSTELVQ